MDTVKRTVTVKKVTETTEDIDIEFPLYGYRYFDNSRFATDGVYCKIAIHPDTNAYIRTSLNFCCGSIEIESNVVALTDSDYSLCRGEYKSNKGEWDMAVNRFREYVGNCLDT